MKYLSELLRKHREGVLYILFGAATTAVNWIVYTLYVTLLRGGITAGNAVAWVVAVIFAFFVNKHFVFQSRTESHLRTLREAVSFLGTRIFSGLIEIFLPALLILLGLDGAFFGIAGSLAKFVTAFLVIVLNYVLSKFLVFAK